MPIAGKVFGSRVIPMGLKLCFLQPLVLSRCLFHAHIFVPSSSHVKALNNVHMRVLRKLVGAERVFGRGSVQRFCSRAWQATEH